MRSMLSWTLLLVACGGGAPEAPLPDSDVLCERVVGGVAGHDELLDLSAAHAVARLFGPEATFQPADAALAMALQGAAPQVDLDAYADGLAGVCVADAVASSLGAAQVKLVGEVAWVYPGTGEVVLPEGATAVVLDLRALPADVSDEVLRAAVAPALAASVPRASVQTRVSLGSVDQYFSPDSPYTLTNEERGTAPLVGTGSQELPLVVVNDATMAPAAAALAADLVLAGRAALAGHDLLTAVAEQRWMGVGDRGLAVRVADHPDWPDRIAPSVRTDDAEQALETLDLAALVGSTPQRATHERDGLATRSPYGEPVNMDLSDAVLRASLVTVHGALRAFWPYFSVSGEELDARLYEVLPRVDAQDREGFVQLLGRLGESLHDGHVFFGDNGVNGSYSSIPVAFDFQEDGTPVVRAVVPRAGVEGEVQVGDVLEAVDGRPIQEVMDELMAWHGAATPGYSRELASRALVMPTTPATWTLRSPDGSARDLPMERRPPQEAQRLPWGSPRENGDLTDLGAPDIAYLNLDGGVTTSMAEVDAVLATVPDSAGLVVDMRGYPGTDHYAVAQRLVLGSFSSPVFRVTQRSGLGESDVTDDQYPLFGNRDFDVPIVLVVGPRTVSAAENFSQMLVGADAVHVVGRQSAATNGNITGLVLPGRFYLSFTGMEVRFPDGGVFHGVGIQPERSVPLVPEHVAAGLDDDLIAAMEVIRAAQ